MKIYLQGVTMKTIIKRLVILSSLILLVACDNTLQRTDRLISLVQENVTQLVNQLNEIQLAESDLQADFEETLHAQGDKLTSFAQGDAKVYQNIKRRQDHLRKLEELTDQLVEYAEEFTKQANKSNLPVADSQRTVDLMVQLADDLTTYNEDYKHSLTLEEQTYQSIASPEMDYTKFFGVFDNVQTLQTTNHINLERVLSHFEPINTQLINFKVYLTNLQED